MVNDDSIIVLAIARHAKKCKKGFFLNISAQKDDFLENLMLDPPSSIEQISAASAAAGDNRFLSQSQLADSRAIIFGK